MAVTTFLDRSKHPETAKAQFFYSLVSIFDGMVIAFLTIFLNECRRVLSWSQLMTSFSLFLPPFGAAIGIILCSKFVNTHHNNLKLIRIVLSLLLLALLALGLTGIYLPNGLDEGGEIVNHGQYYLLYSVFLFLPSLIMGLYWAFASLHTCSIADINYVEKTRYGHVCLYGSLMPIICSPLAGLIAGSLFSSYRGYLFLFLVASPLLLMLILFTYVFHPFPSSFYHDDGHENVSVKELFKNKTYLLYLFLAVLWIPSLWAGDSLSSNLWTALEGREGVTNSFNSLSWGFFLSVSSLMEFIFVFLNTKFGIGKRVRFSMTFAFVLLLVMSIGLGVVAYFYRVPLEDGLSVALVIIAIHSLKGMSNGLYLTSNILMLHHIVGPKKRRKAVFIAPFLYQLMNSLLQLAYPYLSDRRYIAFFVLASIALLGFSLSLLLDVQLLHRPPMKKED